MADDTFRIMLSSSFRQIMSARLEWFLDHGTAQVSREQALVMRRARGFGLIGIAVVLPVAFVAAFSHDALNVVIATTAILAFIVGGIGISFIQDGAWIRPTTHVAIGASLVGIIAVSAQIGEGNDTSATFPILLILLVSYVLGAKAAAGWTLASIVGIGLQIYTSELPAIGIDGAVTTRPGLFATRAIVFIGVFAMAAVERRFADRKGAQLEFLARHDELTGLCNRRAFAERAEEAVARASRHDRSIAVLVIDLDHFKAVNDAHGHAAGDEVLRVIGRRIDDRTRSTDSACRMGGDEFLLLLEDVSDEKNVTLYAERLVAAICEPVPIGGDELSVGASLGVAISPDAGATPEELTRSADIAMFSAKCDGGSRVHAFRSSMSAGVSHSGPLPTSR